MISKPQIIIIDSLFEYIIIVILKEQKRLELFLAREQKKPMEDMCITDGKVVTFL